jgi:signal transduction histidine kinase
MKLSVKIIIILEILLIGSISIIGFFSYVSGTDAMDSRIEAQLESVLNLKKYYLSSHIDKTKEHINLLANQIGPSITNKSYDNVNIREIIQENLHKSDEFSEIFIIDINGIVQISTNRDHEKKIRSNENYFTYGKNDSYIQSFYYDLFIKNTSIILSIPLKDNDDELVGVLAGRANISIISNIIDDVSGLGNSGETYLVNDFNYVISKLRKQPSESLKKTIYTPIVTNCLELKPTTFHFFDTYMDYNNDLVIGGSLFIKELNAGLIAKIDQQEVYAELYDFSAIVMIISISTISLVTIIVYYVIKKITNNIEILDQSVKKITNGDFSQKINIYSNDEIGSLSHSFNKMKISLQNSRDQLETYNKNLKQKIEKRTEELSFSKKQLENNVKHLKLNKIALQNMMSDLRETIDELQIAQQEIKEKNKNLELTQKELAELNINLERKVEERTKEIKDILHQKDEFIGQLGHDLKNPLGPLINLIPILLAKTENEDDREILSILMKNVTYMKNLVVKTLDLARLNSPNTKFDFEQISMKDEINEAVQNNQFMFDENNIKVDTDLDVDYFVNADKLRLNEVFNNLLNNAVKYSNEKGFIKINVEENENEIIVSIKDNGIGMDNDQLNHVFDEFYKADSSRHDFDSSGLGMPICKRIIEKHGGSIWVESKGIGKGSTFYFTLPKDKKVKK